MELQQAVDWAAGYRWAALITLRADGRPQSSDIVYGLVDGRFLISVSPGRDKTANVRRDSRTVLHISDPSTSSYVAMDGTSEVIGPATAVDDEINDLLVAYFEAAKGEPHSDWDEYRRAMVNDGRLLIAFTPTSAVGQIR